MANPIEIGKRIKLARELKGMTQEQLGKEVGMNKSTIQRYETGQVSKIKLPVVESLAKSLSVNPDWLIEKSDIMDNLVEIQPFPYKNIAKALADPSTRWAKLIDVYKSVKCDKDECILIDFVKHTYIDDISDFENHIALLIPNDDLEPEFNNNDIAIIHKQKELENNKYFYIIVDNIPFIRKITFNTNSNNIVLKADNPKLDVIIQPINKLNVIGKVVAIQKNKKL